MQSPLYIVSARIVSEVAKNMGPRAVMYKPKFTKFSVFFRTEVGLCRALSKKYGPDPAHDPHLLARIGPCFFQVGSCPQPSLFKSTHCNT